MPLATHAGSIKLWLHAAASIAIAAWISPLVFNASQALVEVTSGKPTNGPLEHLAALCRRMDFHESFAATAAGCALLLFIPFADWLRSGMKDDPVPWRACLPRPDGGESITRRVLRGPVMAMAGFTATAVPLITVALLAAGSRASGPVAAIPAMFAAAIVQAAALEWYFRNVALGLFLRSLRPAAAIALSAVFFTVVTSSLPRTSPAAIDPESTGAGFALLTHHLAGLARPAEFIATAAPSLALGFLLATSRWRTGSLWMPAGLHAGWLAGCHMMGAAAAPGPAARTILSLAVIFTTALAVRRFTRTPHASCPPIG